MFLERPHICREGSRRESGPSERKELAQAQAEVRTKRVGAPNKAARTRCRTPLRTRTRYAMAVTPARRDNKAINVRIGMDPRTAKPGAGPRPVSASASEGAKRAIKLKSEQTARLAR